MLRNWHLFFIAQKSVSDKIGYEYYSKFAYRNTQKNLDKIEVMGKNGRRFISSCFIQFFNKFNLKSTM